MIDTLVTDAILSYPALANATLLHAIITALASIIGSEFLVLGPILKQNYVTIVDGHGAQSRKVVQVQYLIYVSAIGSERKDNAMHKATLDEAQIREAAYGLWLQEGQPQGRDQDHWMRAIETLSVPAPKAKAVRKAAAKPHKPCKAKLRDI